MEDAALRGPVVFSWLFYYEKAKLLVSDELNQLIDQQENRRQVPFHFLRKGTDFKHQTKKKHARKALFYIHACRKYPSMCEGSAANKSCIPT